MKLKLLLLTTLLSTLTYAQTFDWETASISTITARQTVGGVRALFTSANAQLVDAGGYAGSSGKIVTSSVSSIARVRFTNPSTLNPLQINITSIYVFDGSSSAPQNVAWTLTPIGGTNSPITINVGGNLQGVNLTVNWTGVTGFNIQSANGNDGFSLDNVVFTPYTAPACTVNIPDANFKAALVADTAINTNGNTEIECSEATAFTGTISVPNLSISDLTGIEAFTNITVLECQNNQLTTSLNLSNNTALTRLWCFNNQITSLDISNNTVLDRLRCQNNQLTSLDISNNTDLFFLSCGDNQLTSIDVSNNTALGVFFCNSNSLTSLDVSANTSLFYLLCQNNNLSSLNVANSNNTNFMDPVGTPREGFNASNNPSLSCIQVDDVAYSTTNWPFKDATASYNTNCGVLSVSDFNLESISLYPNPTTSVLNIEMSQNLKLATIYTVLGAKILTTTSNTINTSNLENGLYLIKIENTTGTITTKRFIKK